MTPGRRLLELLLMVREDCYFDAGWYVLRPYSVETLLEQALVAARELAREQEPELGALRGE